MTSTAKTPSTPAANDRVWLVAHDFSTCADAAAEIAITDLLDSRAGGRIILMHAYMVLIPGATIEGGALPAGFTHLEQAAMLESTRALERVAERLRKRANNAGTVQIEVLARMGTPAEAVLEEADRLGASRIVVGTHGRTGVKHLLLGSVAERIVRRAKVPVVVAHDANAKKERP